MNFSEKTIYLLHYPKGKNASYSVGIIKEINDKKTIIHLCETEKGSSGGPIINLINYKVIGIHIGGNLIHNFNHGTFLKEPIDLFNQKFNNFFFFF